MSIRIPEAVIDSNVRIANLKVAVNEVLYADECTPAEKQLVLAEILSDRLFQSVRNERREAGS